MHHLVGLRMPGNTSPEWSRRFGSLKYMHAVSAFQACFWKFNHVAESTAQSTSAIQQWVEHEANVGPDRKALSNPAYHRYHVALLDLPIYLDSLLFYLRIQADTLARLIPYFYETTDHGKISTGSFRDQSKWFCAKKPDFDPDYALVLQQNSDWFELLAGQGTGGLESKGLRDIVVHHGGTYQLGWSIPDSRTDFKLTASLVTHSGFRENDLIAALREVAFGWCVFLDAVYEHFAGRLSTELAQTGFDRNAQSRYLHLGGQDWDGSWIYPHAAQHGVQPTWPSRRRQRGARPSG